jgi:Ser-tRNA(Ala) deacylase AlaX
MSDHGAIHALDSLLLTKYAATISGFENTADQAWLSQSKTFNT